MTASSDREPSVAAAGFLAAAFARLVQGMDLFLREVILTDEPDHGREGGPDAVGWGSNPDLRNLLRIWESNSKKIVESPGEYKAHNVGRNWPNQIMDFRDNQWAHHGSYDDEAVLSIIGKINIWLGEIGVTKQAGEVGRIADELETLIFSDQTSNATSSFGHRLLSVAEEMAGRNIDTLFNARPESTEVSVFADGFVAKAWYRLAEGLGPKVVAITGRQLKSDCDVAEILRVIVREEDQFEDVWALASQLADHRNRWAHQGNCAYRRAQEILRLTKQVLLSVSAEEQAEVVDRMAAELRRIRIDPQQRLTELEKHDTPAVRTDPEALKPVILLVRELGTVDLQRQEHAIGIPTYEVRLATPIEPVPPAGPDRTRLHEIVAECTELIDLNTDDAATYIRRGRAHHDLGNIEAAAADFAVAIAIDPNIEKDLAWAKNLLGQGDRALQEGHYEQAIEHYSRALLLNKRYAAAYNNRGLAYAFAGYYERAIADFTEVVDIDGSAAGYGNRGRAHDRAGDYEKAIADLTEAIGIGDNSAGDYIDRGVAYGRSGNHPQAIADFTESINIDDNSADAYFSRGVAYTHVGDHAQAIADFSKAIAIDGDFANAYLNRGELHGDAGDYERAIADFTEAIRIDDNSANAYTDRGLAYDRSGDYEQAIADFSKAIEIDEDSALAYLGLGLSRGLIGDYERAIEDLTRAIDIDENSALAYVNRGEFYCEIGDYERAIEDLTKAIDIDGNLVGAYSNRVVAYTSIGEYDLAIADLDTATELTPDNEEFRELLPLARDELVRLRDYTAECYRKIEENRDNPDGWHRLGCLWLDNEDYELAIDDFGKARDLDPESAEVWTHLGLAHAGNGDYDRAIASFDRAVELGRDSVLARYQRGRILQMRMEYGNAIVDFSEVIRLNPNYGPAYQNRGICHLRSDREDFARADFDKARKMGFEP